MRVLTFLWLRISCTLQLNIRDLPIEVAYSRLTLQNQPPSIKMLLGKREVEDQVAPQTLSASLVDCVEFVLGKFCLSNLETQYQGLTEMELEKGMSKKFEVMEL